MSHIDGLRTPFHLSCFPHAIHPQHEENRQKELGYKCRVFISMANLLCFNAPIVLATQFPLTRFKTPSVTA